MSESTEVPASYNEPAPGAYSTEEHLKAQQAQTSAVNGEPLHPELSDESELADPAEVGKKPATPKDSAEEAGVSDDGGKHGDGSK